MGQFFEKSGGGADAPIYFSYDQVGNLTLGEDDIGADTVQEFDKLDRMTKKVTVAGLSTCEVSDLLRAAADPSRYLRNGEALALRDRACLELLYGLGVRRSEAGRARVQDLRLADGSLVVK